MFRFIMIMLVCTLVAAAGAADAQPTRDRLDGFNGVRFGTSLEQAKQALGKNKDVCLQVGTRMLTTLARQYGKPNSDKKDTYTRTLVFKFKDGNEIEAVSSFSVFCVTFASYFTPQGKND